MARHSSSSINTPTTGEVTGIPKGCDCGRGVTLRISRTDANPNRSYFRCDLAHELKLSNDTHLFKWLDIALVEEAGLMTQRFEDFRIDIRKLCLVMKDSNDKSEEALMVVKNECKKLKRMLLFVLLAIVGFFVLSKEV